jgi:RimJ/RimL family protein N-acetyltransferase
MKIRPFTMEDAQAQLDHFIRHTKESNEKGALRFAPVEDCSLLNLGELKPQWEKSTSLPSTQPGWRRMWVLEAEDGRVVGGCSLQGGGFSTNLHRCSFGVGIEKEARGMGHGWALIETALNWAKAQDHLFWVDLNVFSNNEAARKLYDSFGFQTFGMVMDRFRIHGESIDDIHMCLLLREE